MKLLNLEALNEKEKEKLRCFLAKHKDHTVTSNGSNFVYKICPCSIGTVLIIRCCCGEEKDITDFDSW